MSALRIVNLVKLNGDATDAAALGNNAAWCCSCDRVAPLLASVYAKREIKCPNCARHYILQPMEGHPTMAGDVKEVTSTRTVLERL